MCLFTSALRASVNKSHIPSLPQNNLYVSHSLLYNTVKHNIIPQIQIVQSKNSICIPRDNVIFLRYFTQIHDFAMQREIIISHGRSTVGYLSFIDPKRGGFGVIFPEVMIFSEGLFPRGKYHHRGKYRRIPRAEGL